MNTNNNIPQTIKSPLDGALMQLVWNDEFDSDTLDSSKWNLYDRMWGKERVITTTEKKNFNLENSHAVMRT